MNSPESLNCCSLPEEIPLTQGFAALVDQCDYEFLMQWNWQCRSGYAKRTGTVAEGKRVISMHCSIMQPPVGMVVDHINGDTLDNRRSNLRICTSLENHRNRRPERNSSSRYKGVSWQQKTQYWKSYIVYERKYIHLGVYLNEEDAARAYNIAARKYHGAFAKLNPVEGEPPPTLIHPTQYKWHESKRQNHV